MFSRNVRLLLWRKAPKNRQKWVAELALWARTTDERARALLLGESPPNDAEMTAIADATHHTDADLSYSDLVEESKVDILAQNLTYLLDSLEHGKRQELAQNLHVHKGTVSRWGARTRRPSLPKLQKLAEHFGLSVGKLQKEPLFLSIEPVTAVQKREWVCEQVRKVPEKELAELYPALRKLLTNDR